MRKGGGARANAPFPNEFKVSLCFHVDSFQNNSHLVGIRREKNSLGNAGREFTDGSLVPHVKLQLGRTKKYWQNPARVM